MTRKEEFLAIKTCDEMEKRLHEFTDLKIDHDIMMHRAELLRQKYNMMPGSEEAFEYYKI